VGYLFSFLMATLILVTSLYAFSQLTVAGRENVANAQVREVANRVALGVQETLQVAAGRTETIGTGNSTKLRFSHPINVPETIQDWQYDVSLDENYINGSIASADIDVSVATFNAAVTLPPVGVCTAAYIVCTLSGTNTGDMSQIVMTYEFDSTGAQLVNKIEIS